MSNKTQLQTNNAKLETLIQTLQGKAAGGSSGGSGGGSEPITYTLVNDGNEIVTVTYMKYANGILSREYLNNVAKGASIENVVALSFVCCFVGGSVMAVTSTDNKLGYQFTSGLPTSALLYPTTIAISQGETIHISIDVD